MKPFIPVLFAAAAFGLSACQTDDVISLESASETQAAAEQEVRDNTIRLPQGQAECAIYYAVLGKLLIEKREPSANIVAGCPESASIGADISPSGSAPSAPSARQLVNRMVDKGVPRDVANEVSRSAAFRQWLRQEG